MWFTDSRKPDEERVYGGIDENALIEKDYPKYLYRFDDTEREPILVMDISEEVKARADGYDNMNASLISNKHLINWFWDLEDFSAKQLVVFAKEEFDVDLPIEADQDTLFRAVLRLSRAAPQNQGRLVLMAHTIKMEYEQTLVDIKKMQERESPEVITQVMEL